MFHMINKQALLVEVRCTLLASIFIYFKIILQVLEAPNAFCSAKKFLLEALYWLTAPRKYPSVIFCSQY